MDQLGEERGGTDELRVESAAVLEEERWRPGHLQIGNEILHIGTGSADLRAEPDVEGSRDAKPPTEKPYFKALQAGKWTNQSCRYRRHLRTEPCLFEVLLKKERG
jgi:hypothetical protein